MYRNVDDKQIDYEVKWFELVAQQNNRNLLTYLIVNTINFGTALQQCHQCFQLNHQLLMRFVLFALFVNSKVEPVPITTE